MSGFKSHPLLKLNNGQAKESKKIARMTLKDKLAAAERQIAELMRTNEEQRVELEKLKAGVEQEAFSTQRRGSRKSKRQDCHRCYPK